MELRVGDRVQPDLRMEVVGVNKQVTVTSEAELLDTSTATHRQVIDSKSVQDLPLLGHIPSMLTHLLIAGTNIYS